MKQIKAYQCDHCRKLYKRPKSCEKHEVICKSNPENSVACDGCKFLTKKDVTQYYDTPVGERNRLVNVLFCLQYEHPLFHPINRIKGNTLDLADNGEMPKQCPDRQEEDLDSDWLQFFNSL